MILSPKMKHFFFYFWRYSQGWIRRTWLFIDQSSFPILFIGFLPFVKCLTDGKIRQENLKTLPGED
jgi:hypothetical protein